MRFIFSGGFIGEDGLLEADIRDIEYIDSLCKLRLEEGFYVFSYELTKDTLGINIKEAGFPKIMRVKLGDVNRYKGHKRDYILRFLNSSFTEKEFKQGVKRIKKYIEEGVVYQINLTNRFDFSFYGDVESFFVDLFLRQPTAYAFLLDVGDFALISGSMELFLERRGEKLWSKPIKGTGLEPETISGSQKERAENLMITDMVRNDLGKVAKPGTVQVEELFKVERYATLCQMHSSICAISEKDFTDIFNAMFPPASVTGAPKMKAVEIIDLLEKHPRSYYCGCAGFLQGRDLTLSLLIRTALKEDDKISYFSGCGIVWDSYEEKEWEELLLKVRAFYPDLVGKTLSIV